MALACFKYGASADDSFQHVARVLAYLLNLQHDTVRRHDHQGHMHGWKHCSNVNDAVQPEVPGPEKQNLSGPHYVHLQDQAVRRFGDNEEWS